MSKKTKQAQLSFFNILPFLIAVCVATSCTNVNNNRTIPLNKPLPTQLIINGIYVIKNKFANFYLIQERDQYIAIDAGNNPDITISEMKKLNIDPQKVKAVFLTHSDPDHIACVGLFPSAEIFLSRQEEQLINGKKNRFLIYSNSSSWKKVMGGRDYKVLNDNQVVNFSNIKIKAISTPGHTIGSMCYLVNDEILFTGDALSLKNGKVDWDVDLCDTLYIMDVKSYKLSLKKLASITNIKYIFTAHYGFASNKTEPFKKSSK